MQKGQSFALIRVYLRMSQHQITCISVLPHVTDAVLPSLMVKGDSQSLAFCGNESLLHISSKSLVLSLMPCSDFNP